jgi:M61 glycyl aminopeptidase
MRARLRRAGFALWLALFGCAGARPSARDDESARDPVLHYSVRVAPQLDRIDVVVCGRLAGEWIAGRAEAAERLSYASWLDPPATKLPTPEGVIQLGERARSGCFGYGVQLHEGGSLSAVVGRAAQSVLASPNAWLWRPRRRPPTLRAELTLDLPPGMSASLPWAVAAPAGDGGATGDRYWLDADAFAFDSYAAFGRFETLRGEGHGTVASAALLDALPNLDGAAGARWLSEALHIAAQSDGRFPARALQLVVVPAGAGGEPFGNVARGGGASVLMFVPRSFGAAELRRDWVLPHELSHLLLPLVAREDAWLPEGLATYYQELLRARAGVLSKQQALANVAEALRSAVREGTGRTLAAESRDMHRTRAYRSVYWGGAGFLLIADVELRRASGGAKTLDGLLSALRAESSELTPRSARAVLAQLDALGGVTLFGALARAVETRSFPDFEPTLKALGVRADGTLSEAAPLATLRDALLAPVAERRK